MNITPESPKDAVLEKIRAGAVRMRPKLYFILKASAVAFVAFLVLAVSVFLASFIFFAIRLNGSDSLLGFGPRGLGLFLETFPWPLALLDLVLILGLEWLLRRFRFAYSRSVLLILLALLAVVGGIGVTVSQTTRFHDDLFEHAEREGLPPPLGAFYRGAHQKPPEELGVYRGVVTTIGSETFVLTHEDFDQDQDEGDWVIAPPDGFDIAVIQIGDRVFVAGDIDGEIVRAYGIRILPPPPVKY